MAVLSLGSAAVAQAPSSMQWDTAGMLLGQRATIVIGDQLQVVCIGSFHALEEYGQNGIVPLSQRLDTLGEAASKPLVRQLTTVTCFDPGEHKLGFGADSLTLVVNDYPGVDTASTDIKDIADILPEPRTFWEIFRWVLLGLILAAIAGLAARAIRKRKGRKPLVNFKPADPPLPPKQRALDELEALRLRELWKQGRAKEYHTELTDIVRHYLKERYGVDSTEMTSGQTIEAFAVSEGFSEDRASLLLQILRMADMVKFAKAEPLPYEHEKSLTNAIAFVQAEKGQAAEQGAVNPQNK
ncbi:MAG: hypothetical protein SPJ13_05675 [Bacteroidales bacterium]|nr:hypothetical protein [Bacteroidales bacterium]